MPSSPSARLLRAAACVTLASLGASLGACGDTKLGPDVPASVAATAGDSQTLIAGNRASAPLVVEIENTDESPLANVAVRWTVVSGGGSLQAVVDTTDVDGQASTVFFSPAVAGTVKVSAQAAHSSRQFTITVVADTVGTISAYAGDGAAALVGYQLTLVAKATDRFGNGMKGVGVAWSSSGGILQVTSGVTDSTGMASNIVTVGPDTGKVSIVATSRFNAVTFTVSALRGP